MLVVLLSLGPLICISNCWVNSGAGLSPSSIHVSAERPVTQNLSTPVAKEPLEENINVVFQPLIASPITQAAFPYHQHEQLYQENPQCLSSSNLQDECIHTLHREFHEALKSAAGFASYLNFIYSGVSYLDLCPVSEETWSSVVAEDMGTPVATADTPRTFDTCLASESSRTVPSSLADSRTKPADTSRTIHPSSAFTELSAISEHHRLFNSVLLSYLAQFTATILFATHFFSTACFEQSLHVHKILPTATHAILKPSLQHLLIKVRRKYSTIGLLFCKTIAATALKHGRKAKESITSFFFPPPIPPPLPTVYPKAPSFLKSLPTKPARGYLSGPSSAMSSSRSGKVGQSV